MPDWQTPFRELLAGKGRKIEGRKRHGHISIGPIGNEAAEAAWSSKKKAISAAHYDMRYLKPIDEEILHEMFTRSLIKS